MPVGPVDSGSKGWKHGHNAALSATQSKRRFELRRISLFPIRDDWTSARIALCLRYHGIREICTLDADFSKYPFLKVVAI